jgi:hypothetical protein
MNITGLNGIQEHHDFIPYGKLVEEWEPAAVQRVIDPDRVSQIAESIRQGRSIQGTFSFTLAVLNNRRILVDGQHRFMALRDLMVEKPSIEDLVVHIRCIPLQNSDQALQLVNELGNVSPVKPVNTLEERACMNNFEIWLKSCVNKPKNSKQPQYGNYSEHFLDNLKQTGFFGKFDDASKMMSKCKELNRWVYQTVIHISRSKMKNVSELASFICPDVSKFAISSFEKFCKSYSKLSPDEVDRLFCLHLVVNYGFAEIVKYMVELNWTTEDIWSNSKEKNVSKRLIFNFNASFDKKTDKLVVEKFFATEDVRKCPVCLRSDIDKYDRSTFALGHILAHSRGGTNEPRNLIPICHRCNLDCKADHLNDYCKRLFNRDIVS